MIWNPNKECMSRDERAALQGKRLHKIVSYVYHNVPFYRHKMQEMDVRPDDIQTIEDITKLPFTTKKDLRDNYPFGLQAAPQSEIIRIHASSGTTGNPTIVGYTRKDIGVWSECMARCLTAFGVSRNDIFSVSYGYGLFTGGLGAHYGVEQIGASVVPASTGNTEKHLKLIRDLGITGIACTPSYALYLAETMDKMGISKDQIKLRVGAFGAEPWTENMRKEIQERLGLKGYNIYGLSEVMGPSVSYECQEQNGSHINEDHFYPEIINPVTLENLPVGQTGELVFTTLTKEGMPVLRYRTRDLCSLLPGECGCGRTNIRMGRIEGRALRRHAHHPWYQRLPITGRERSTVDEGVCTTLHVGSGPREQSRHPASTGRAASGILHRHIRHACRHCRIREETGSQAEERAEHQRQGTA